MRPPVQVLRRRASRLHCLRLGLIELSARAFCRRRLSASAPRLRAGPDRPPQLPRTPRPHHRAICLVDRSSTSAYSFWFSATIASPSPGPLVPGGEARQVTNHVVFRSANPRRSQPRAHGLRRLRPRGTRKPESRRRRRCVFDNWILICRRAIDPRKGFWTLRACCMELGETLEGGAAREALEEHEAISAIDGILGVFSIARIGQVQVISGPVSPTARRSSLPVRKAWRCASSGRMRFVGMKSPSPRYTGIRTHGSVRVTRRSASPPGNPSSDRRGIPQLQFRFKPAGEVRTMRKFLLVALVTPFSFAMADDLPVPPAPPDHLPLADAAPVPNADAEAPVAPTSAEPSVNIRLYRANIYDPGVAFVPGSRYQSSEDRKPIQTPGLSISVPLK